MPVSVCPAALVAAPPDRVWRLLTDPALYDSWADAQVMAVEPPGPIHLGQRIRMRSRGRGRWWPVDFLVLGIDRDRRWLELDVVLPFGIVNHERITLDPYEQDTLVRFN